MATLPRVLHSLAHPTLLSSNRGEVQLISQLLDAGDLVWSELLEKGGVIRLATSVCQQRICSLQWVVCRPNRRWLTAILRLCRQLFRHAAAVDEFFALGKFGEYVQFCTYVATALEREDDDYTASAKLVLNISSRLAASNPAPLASVRLHRVALRSLHSCDMLVVQAALELLAVLCDGSAQCRTDLCETAAVDGCLHLLPDGDILTQKLSASLLRILCGEEQARQQLRVYDGVPVLVGLLSIGNSRLKWHVAWCLAQLADDQETASEIAQLGGITLLLADVSAKPPTSGINDWVAMLAAECAVLAQLAVVSPLQASLVQANAIFLFGRLLLLPLLYPSSAIVSAPALPTLQCSSLRVLRLLFSSERHRPLFRRVFPVGVLEKFVDVGNYVQDLSAYPETLLLYQQYLETASLAELDTAWETSNQRRKPIGRVGEYEMLEQLGAGAFGCVYTARKATASAGGTPKLFAVKEIFMVQQKSDDKSFGDVISEVKIIKQQLRHPNVVRYRRIFEENGRLYVVMDLVDGSPLRDLITLAKERSNPFSEERIWNYLIQLLLGLRYLHKEKRIVHRDLKPSNIMIGEDDRLVITDFGLARHRDTDYLKSAAGTIIYSCPEVVQSEPYGDKADVWSLGCVLYETAALRPTFHSTNMLKLAKMIVEAEYEPLPKSFSEELREVVTSCLKVDPKERPDVVQLSLSPAVSPRLLDCLDDALRAQADFKKEMNKSSGTATPASVTPKPSVDTPREKRAQRKATGPDSIDKPRTRVPLKPLSAGQPPRSSSTCSLPQINPSSGQRVRSSEGLTLRCTALKPVTDPVLGILDQVRRLMTVTTAARRESVNHRRRLAEQFKKRVFSKDITPEQMKTHFRRLAVESPEEIDLDLGFADFRVIFDEMGTVEAGELRVRRLTYEQLAAILQSLLTDSEVGS